MSTPRCSHPDGGSSERRSRRLRIGTILVVAWSAVAAFTGASPAAVSFSDTFDGPTFHPALAETLGHFAFANGNTYCTGPRSYVRTVASDFNTVDFVATVSYTINGGGGAGGVFIGIGPAIGDGGFYGEPLHSCYVLDHAGDFHTTTTVVRTLAASGQAVNLVEWGSPQDGTHAVRMSKVGDTITFAVDLFYDGAFAADNALPVNINDLPWLNATNSHLFFGTDVSPSVFHDMVVTTSATPIAELSWGRVKALYTE